MISFKSGIAIDILAQKYSCTKLTIIRNLKKNLGEFRYKEFFNKSKSLKKESKAFNSCISEIVENGSTNAQAVRYCNGGN